MSHREDYTDSGRSDNGGKPYPDTWKSLGDLAKALAEKAAQK